MISFHAHIKLPMTCGLIAMLFAFSALQALDLLTVKATEPLLILNMQNEEVLPKNFRMTADPFVKTAFFPPSMEGLAALKASASGQFSEKSFEKILATIPNKKVLVIDLRQESHGFLDGVAVSWYGERDWANKGKTSAKIIEDERQRLQAIAIHGSAVIHEGTRLFSLTVKKVSEEEAIVQSRGANYLRIFVTDHCQPSDKDVDFFLRNVHNLAEDYWIHFHCAAGRGRSTTFMVMYDMLHNATTVSYVDLLTRQSLLGGKDLMAEPDKTKWKYPYLVDRQTFLKEFYRFCREGNPAKTAWSEWKSSESLKK